MVLVLSPQINELGIKDLLEVTHLLAGEGPIILAFENPIRHEQREILVGESIEPWYIILSLRESRKQHFLENLSLHFLK